MDKLHGNSGVLQVFVNDPVIINIFINDLGRGKKEDAY